MGLRGPSIIPARVRLQGNFTWEIIDFIVNSVLFVLVGLQLRGIVEDLSGYTAADLIGWALAICGVTVLIRLVWFFTVPYLIRALDRRPSQRERRVSARERLVIGWSGMRGAVSLAAALALPLTVKGGASVSRSRTDPVPHLRSDLCDPRRPGAVAPGSDPAAPDQRRRSGGGRGAQGAPRRDSTPLSVSLGTMCRHTVGLNWTAIGIENVGFSDAQVLDNPRQMSADLRLVHWLRCRFDIEIKNVIGHNESLSSPYHREDVVSLRTQTHSDFNHADMQVYRARLRALGGCPPA